jgi:hypothetical protein
MKIYTQNEINDIAQIGLDAACFAIQEKLGQKYGDLAGVFFSGLQEDMILSILKSYIQTEINFAGQKL